MRGRKVAALAIAGVMVALALGLVGWVVVHPGVSIRNEIAVMTWPHSFTTTAWQSHPTKRWAMARDLAESGLLRGLSAAEVGRLLDQPADSDSPLLDIPVPSPGWPDDHLRVWFDNGVVSGWSLNSDPELGPTDR